MWKKWLLGLLVLTMLLQASETKTRKKKKSRRVKQEDVIEFTDVRESKDWLSLPNNIQMEMLQASPQALFQLGTDACSREEYKLCYCAFQFFQQSFPHVLEGFTNAAVALERIGRREQAKGLYRTAIKKFPENPLPVSGLVNLLQFEAIKLYSDKDFKGAHSRYKEIVKVAPDIYDVRINMGNILENVHDYDGARDAYMGAIKMDPENVKGFNSLCRLKLIEVTGPTAGRFEVTQEQRHAAFAEAKQFCAQALEVAPDEPMANQNLGMLYKESLDFDTAIQFFRKAYELGKDDYVIIQNLATTLGRNDEVPEALQLLQKMLKLIRKQNIVEVEPTAIYSIGTITAPHNRTSEEGKKAHIEGMKMKIDRGPGPDHPEKCTGRKRKLRLSPLETDSVGVDIVGMVDEDSQFGKASPRVLGNQNKLTELGVGEIPLQFMDKQTVALTFENVYMEGPSGLLYTDCEVFAVVGINTEIPRDYIGTAETTIRIDNPVVSLLHPSINNYYHWTAEVATRFLLSMDYYLGDDEDPGILPDVQFLLPSKVTSEFAYHFIETFNIKLPREPLVYVPAPNKRYFFKELHRFDWAQLDTFDPDQTDLWADYLPSRMGLWRLREFVQAHQAEREAKGLVSPSAEILYVSRSGVREVQNQDILIDMLETTFGDRFSIHDVSKAPGSIPGHSTLQDQLDMFHNVKIIIGPHGAGLINMIYAPDDASIIEFPMKPQCNRCFGFVAMALELDYWVVPEVSAFYHLKYTMTKEKAKTVMDTVIAVAKEKNIKPEENHDEL
eukprot:m.16421 g.16421  ORF g.16421 m.16421 type:complete len:782 (+) comp5696_c0_seq2:137-2482(+)